MSCSCPWSRLTSESSTFPIPPPPAPTSTSTTRASSNVLPRQGVGPAFQSATASQKIDQLHTVLRHQHDPRCQPRLRASSWSLVVRSHGPRHGPQWQLGLGFPYGLSWPGRQLTPGYSAPCLSVQFLLFIVFQTLPHTFLSQLSAMYLHCSGFLHRWATCLVGLWISFPTSTLSTFSFRVQGRR